MKIIKTYVVSVPKRQNAMKLPRPILEELNKLVQSITQWND